MSNHGPRVCPVKRARSLDNRARRWLHDPRKILGPYVKPGMTVLDLGCGPGFFTVVLAELVGESGRVIAVDLQEDMLKLVKQKIQGSNIEPRIKLHKCETDRIGITERVDFTLAFYMVHEVPDKKVFFEEIKTLTAPGGLFLIVEPKFFHVMRKEFEATVDLAVKSGFVVEARPKVFFGQTALLSNSGTVAAG